MAFLKKDNTTTILVKAVVSIRKEGARVRMVRIVNNLMLSTVVWGSSSSKKISRGLADTVCGIRVIRQIIIIPKQRYLLANFLPHFCIILPLHGLIHGPYKILQLPFIQFP